MRVVLLAAKDHLDLLAQMENQETEDSTEYLYVYCPIHCLTCIIIIIIALYT